MTAFQKKILIRRKRIGARCAVLAVGALALTAYALAQQQQQNDALYTQAKSQLAQRNLGLVAASATQIKAVLVTNPGLMVEVKRWVADDATNQGQIIEESDLTDDAILDRIEKDVSLRAATTLILRHYGYLLPVVNPDSELGKQQDLLVQERVKWMAQDEEQQRAKSIQDLQAAQNCLAKTSPDTDACPAQQAEQTTTPTARRANGGAAVSPEAPSEENPTQPNVRPTPTTNGGALPPQLVNLDETAPQSSSDLSMLGLAPSSNAARADLIASTSTDGLSSQGISSFQQLDGQQLDAFGALAPPLPAGMQDLFANESAPNDVEVAQHAYANAPRKASASEQLTKTSGDRGAIEARMVAAKSPYRDIPSLYDMYLQASPQPPEPMRFGAEVFANGSRDPQVIPMDLPAGPDYVVGPGDGLSIDLWGSVSQRLARTVDREGRISLPEAGPVLVSGKSLEQVQQGLQQALRLAYRDESADVSLSRLRTIRVYEVGDVSNPGAYDINSLSTPLNALFAAGGPTPQGSLRIVKHYRGNQLIEQVDLYDLLLHGVTSGMLRLENGDTLLVPPVGPQVAVEGMVRRPAIYELDGEKSLSSVLELAGGLLPAATLRHIEVERLVAHTKQTMLSLDIPETDGDAAVTKQLDSFEVKDGDRIRIYPIAAYNEDAVYLEGHVLRPGRYSYRDNMRVSDLLASFKDLLPEPATQYAEIIRLNAPDFHPTVESFSVAEALKNPGSSPLLQRMDTVRVFSRFDFEDPPSVSVLGDVRFPGAYPTSGQIHVSDAVHLAGGLAPDADPNDAQIFRDLPDGGSKVFSVNLKAAVAGDSSNNILLETRDRLLVHRSTQALQPATVYVEGAVGKPGRYPLTGNMTVADLVRAGGGLKPSADAQKADLTTFSYGDGGAARLTSAHESISLASALSGDANFNVAMHNGDVLTIRELPGWNDLGASITVSGEVKHPGTYGIRSGERLSSVIQRAGGFEPSAYAYGAVLQRTKVRELENREHDGLILRVKDEETQVEDLPETDPKTKQAKDVALQQYQTTLTQLAANPPLGRVSIRISNRIDRWQNTASDIEVRDGDTLTIPKKPEYVMVSGQVFNPTAVSYRPSRSAKWYLQQSGGPTQLANKRAIFVVRADGSVIGGKDSVWDNPLGATLEPGDTIVVPERAIGGGPNWQNLFTSAQLATSIVSSAFIILHY